MSAVRQASFTDVRWTEDLVGPLEVPPVHLAVARLLDGPRFDCVSTRTLADRPSSSGKSVPPSMEETKIAPTAEEVAREINYRMQLVLTQRRAAEVATPIPRGPSLPSPGIIRRHFVSRARRLCHLTPLDVATICVALHQATAPPYSIYFPFVSVRDFARRSTLPSVESLRIGFDQGSSRQLQDETKLVCMCLKLNSQSDIFMCNYDQAMTVYGSKARDVPVFEADCPPYVLHTRLFLSSLAHLGQSIVDFHSTCECPNVDREATREIGIQILSSLEDLCDCEKDRPTGGSLDMGDLLDIARPGRRGYNQDTDGLIPTVALKLWPSDVMFAEPEHVRTLHDLQQSLRGPATVTASHIQAAGFLGVALGTGAVTLVDDAYESTTHVPRVTIRGGAA